jgi:hypothetical protein
MDKETITKRKQELLATREQFLANANAVLGAIQDCDFWLSELDKAANPAPVADPPETK